MVASRLRALSSHFASDLFGFLQELQLPVTFEAKLHILTKDTVGKL